MLAEVHDVQEYRRSSQGDDGIQRRMHDGVLVLTPQGGLDAGVVEALTRIVEDAEAPVLIDLNDCIVVDPYLLRSSGVRRELRSIHDVCVACRRLSARKLLARTSALEDVPVFQSVQDALQARLMHDEGYGPGWSRA